MVIIGSPCIRRGIVITRACFSNFVTQTQQRSPGQPLQDRFRQQHFARSSSPALLLSLLNINHPNQLGRLLSSRPRPPNQPIRQIDHPTGLFRTAAFLCMFNRMRHDPALVVKLENEQAAEFLRLPSQARRIGQPLGESVDLFPRSDATIQRFGVAG